jgi:pimeloyl-ACP methyl ester carboxylesterase
MMRKRSTALVLAALWALCTGPAAAQEAPDIAGAWHGTIPTPTGEITMGLYVTRGENGALEGAIENYDQAPGDKAAFLDITATEGRLAFRVARVNATYQGAWDEVAQQWKGTLTQGQAMPLNWSRGAPAPKPRIEGLDGVWRGSVERNGVTLRQVLRIRTIEQGTFALYDSPDQMVVGLPVADLARNGREVSMTAARGLTRFSGVLSADGTQLSGTWTTPNQPDIALTYTRGEALAQPGRPQTPKEPFPYRVEAASFDNPKFADVYLAGTLTLPEGQGPFPAAVMITGSGGQDRDETVLGHKPFAVIADYLTRHGVAVLRFDDRGVGESKGDYASATSADLATDANAAFAWLAARSDIRTDAIGMIGHSEGGMIGPIAMADNPDVAFLVMLAGPGTGLEQLMLSQRRLLGSQMGMSEAELDRAEPVMTALFKAIAGADTATAGREAAMAVMTPEAKAALGLPAEIDGAVVVNQVSGPWFQYFLKYDPAPNLARIKVPLLALNGALDRQVPPEANLAAIRTATTGNPDVTLVELPGLNHLFQTAGTGGIGEYATIEETFSPVALELMVRWITERFPPAGGAVAAAGH